MGQTPQTSPDKPNCLDVLDPSLKIRTIRVVPRSEVQSLTTDGNQQSKCRHLTLTQKNSRTDDLLSMLNHVILKSPIRAVTVGGVWGSKLLSKVGCMKEGRRIESEVEKDV